MQGPNLYQVLQIDDYSATPKYLQIANGIIRGVQHLQLETGYLLPSIHDLSHELDVAKDTVEKAYRHLRQMGVIGSVPGKGYFIAKNDFLQPFRVLLVFNKLSAHKKIIYDELTHSLGSQAVIDLFVYNNDFSLFRRIIETHCNGYTHNVIIPHFLEGGENAAEVINQLKNGKLILLDKMIPGIQIPFAAVYEDFEKDIFGALEEALPRLSRYRRLRIIFPDYTYFPQEIINGFRNFCVQYAFEHEIMNDITQGTIAPGDVFINLMEDDLVVLLDRIRETNLEVGRDIGIISYNETPWKRHILDGITTISTDFRKMAQMTASQIIHDEMKQLAVPFQLTLRPSL